MALVEVTDLHKTHRTGDVSVHAVRGVDFSIELGVQVGSVPPVAIIPRSIGGTAQIVLQPRPKADR